MEAQKRPIFLLSFGIAIALWFALVTYMLWIRFPIVMHTGDYNLGKWLGPSAARILFELMAACVGGLYLWVAIRGTRPGVEERSWALSVGTGACAGVIVILLYFGTGLLATQLGQLQLPVNVLAVFMLAGPLLLGFFFSWRNRAIRAGILAAFWFGLLLAMLNGIGMIGKDVLFAERLMKTAWLNDTSIADPLCHNVQGLTLLGCEVGDDLGGMASILAMVPVLSLILGTIAGGLGRLIPAGRFKLEKPVRASLTAPLIFTGILILLSLAEIFGKLW